MHIHAHIHTHACWHARREVIKLLASAQSRVVSGYFNKAERLQVGLAVCFCVCMCVCVRACVRACVCLVCLVCACVACVISGMYICVLLLKTVRVRTLVYASASYTTQ